jgi:UDP-N-acetylglucosamine--dolichyl-phosphate N-acetylglucosaminephosphotransferase
MEILKYIGIAIFSLGVSYTVASVIIPRLKRFGFTGKDMHKPNKPEIAEMGGISIVAGLTAGVLLAIMIDTFTGVCTFNPLHLLSALTTVYAIAFIGLIDDLLDIPQWLKAGLPLLASIPLVVVAMGTTTMSIPFIGVIDLGLFYIFVLIPIGVAVAANLTNMLAGFNGMETGMGIIIFSCMSILALHQGNIEMLALFVPMLGALLGFIPFNIFPSKAFLGDVGTLTIGAVLATGVIIGNLETVGALILLLYVIDFLIKLPNKFPKTFVELKDEKLYAPKSCPRGLIDVILKLGRGIKEQHLVIVMYALQVIVGGIVLMLFW